MKDWSKDWIFMKSCQISYKRFQNLVFFGVTYVTVEGFRKRRKTQRLMYP